jgi:hypothetical protein
MNAVVLFLKPLDCDGFCQEEQYQDNKLLGISASLLTGSTHVGSARELPRVQGGANHRCRNVQENAESCGHHASFTESR